MLAISRLLTCIVAVTIIAIVSQFAGPRSMSWLGYDLLAWAAALTLLIQWLAFIPAFLKKTEHFYDLVGSLTYLSLAWLGLSHAYSAGLLTTRRVVLVSLVSLWALRLGSYLFLRVKRRGKDARMDELKRHFPSFLMAWTLQGLWVFLTLLPVLIIMTRQQDMGPIHWIEWVGWSIWGLGWAIELIADQQKSQLQRSPQSRDLWINTGLWAHVQHPNYAGEVILWSGICISGIAHYTSGEWCALLSPIFVYCLLRYVSGVPLLQERARARWGDDPRYQEYARSTPLFVPKLVSKLIPKVFSARD